MPLTAIVAPPVAARNGVRVQVATERDKCKVFEVAQSVALLGVVVKRSQYSGMVSRVEVKFVPVAVSNVEKPLLAEVVLYSHFDALLVAPIKLKAVLGFDVIATCIFTFKPEVQAIPTLVVASTQT